MTIEQRVILTSLDVNIEEVLERFIGNEMLYIKCLKKLLSDTNYDGMLRAIQAGNAAEAFECVHALKGVSANLGLQRLYNETRPITEVFRAGSLDYDKDNLYRLTAEYAEATEKIKQL